MKNSAKTFFSLSAVSLLALTVSACTPVQKIKEDGQYWQRISASSQIYTQGPKAQQMLHRDISRCVTELRELERLGALRNTIPADPEGRLFDPDSPAKPDPDERNLAAWDSPDRIDYLRTEHSDFHDFDSCMITKGWERVKYVPYDVAEKSYKNYLKAHIDYKYQSRFGHEDKPGLAQDHGEYGDLNN